MGPNFGLQRSVGPSFRNNSIIIIPRERAGHMIQDFQTWVNNVVWLSNINLPLQITFLMILWQRPYYLCKINPLGIFVATFLFVLIFERALNLFCISTRTYLRVFYRYHILSKYSSGIEAKLN